MRIHEWSVEFLMAATGFPVLRHGVQLDDPVPAMVQNAITFGYLHRKGTKNTQHTNRGDGTTAFMKDRAEYWKTVLATCWSVFLELRRSSVQWLTTWTGMKPQNWSTIIRFHHRTGPCQTTPTASSCESERRGKLWPEQRLNSSF